MASVLRTIHRIRKYREHSARVELTDAETRAAAQKDRLDLTLKTMSRSRSGVQTADADDVAARHVYALRMEMVRRHEEAALAERLQEVEQRRGVVVAAATEARIAERVAEIREEAAAVRKQDQDRHLLDELGSQGWWRRQQPS